MYNVKLSIEATVGYADLLTDPKGILNEAVLGLDALLPAQLGSRRGSAALEPLKRLMTAVLVDAIRCHQRNIGAVTLGKKREFREAQNWLFKDRDDGPYSFDTVCHVLETDPDRLRRRLVQFQHARDSERGVRANKAPLRLRVAV